MTDFTMPTGRALLKTAVVALAIAAVVLLGLLLGATSNGGSLVLERGEHRELRDAAYAATHAVELPGDTLAVAVGTPVKQLDSGMVEELESDDMPDEGLDTWEAADGGSIVPISWQLLDYNPEDTQPIELHLVAGDEVVEVTRIAPFPEEESAETLRGSRAYGFDQDLALDDLHIEVVYDDLTQVVHVATGEIDAGAAEPLYEKPQSFTNDCRHMEDGCQLHARPADGPVRPFDGEVTVGELELQPYVAGLGWADEGKAWAVVDVLSSAGHATDADGPQLLTARHNAVTVLLDGEKAVRRTGLGTEAHETAGTVVFEVDADAEPSKAKVLTSWSLDDGTRLRLSRSFALEPVE